LVIGGFAFKATPAKAADLGGDCCADLEERVAELEATTVRKGNKKVSVTLSGWVVKSFNWWDDGDLDSAFVGDKGIDLGSRFALTGSATIAPGWSGGFNITVLTTGNLFADSGTLANSNQFSENGGNFFTGQFNPLYSYIYIKSDKWGTLNWGTLSPASDNPAVLADISGTVIESNAVFFEGASFILRPKGAKIGGYGGLDNGLQWEDFLLCHGLNLGIGADCFGAPQPAVRYDSPTWGGFRFETSWGKQTINTGDVPTPELNFWDIAGFYTADWNSIKLSAAAAYTWQESAVLNGSFTPGECDFDFGNPFDPCFTDSDNLTESNLFQIGASILHKPSGLGIYGLYQTEESGGHFDNFVGVDGRVSATSFDLTPVNFRSNTPDTDVWYVKPFWRKTWSPIGATTFFGEYGQYNDQYNANQGDLCSAFDGSFGTNIDRFCNNFTFTDDSASLPVGVFVTGSEVERWGLGVVQEIDSAAMHLFARWQHQEISLDLVGFTQNIFECNGGDVCASVSKQRVGQGFDDWDLFQIGGVIFF
jgi:hypothetical protein